MQQINLYQVSKQTRKPSDYAWFSILSCILCLYGYSLFLTFESVKLYQSVGHHQKQLNLASNRLEELQQKYSSNQSKQQLLDELLLKKKRLTSVRQFLKKIKNQIAQASGIANYFATLAKMSLPGIEFTSISLQQGHTYISIRGYAAEAQSVITLLQTLKRQPDLVGKEFIQLAIHPASHQHYKLAFAISNINIKSMK